MTRRGLLQGGRGDPNCHHAAIGEAVSSAPLSVDLRRAAEHIWETQHRHPFVCGIGDGTLAPERFNVWVRQDYLYLIEFARLHALGAARAPDLRDVTRFSDIAQALLGVEMDLHRSYAREWGVSSAQLESEQMLPTTQGYTDFLIRTAALGDYVELTAALLPCIWGYAEIGERLAAGGRPADERYQRWIAMYTSPEYVELVGWARDLTDRAGEDLGATARQRARRAFLISSRYELAFWQMAWAGERWRA
ncbi:MAG: thiaminase II [Solirubrobacteraceae bacterium]